MRKLVRKSVKALRLLPSSTYRKGLLHGVGAAIEHVAPVRRLGIQTCVDVGANVGQFTLLMRHEHPGAQVIAFEPLAGPAATFTKIFSDDRAVTFHQTALGEARATVDMHVSRHVDSSSLLPISELQTRQFPGTEEAGRETVTVAPMTDFVTSEMLAQPSLLKIDVQGFELEVLKSAEPLLASFKWIYVEASFIPLYEGQALADDVIAHLHQRNFTLKGFYNPSNNAEGQAIQADFLFENAR